LRCALPACARREGACTISHRPTNFEGRACHETKTGLKERDDVAKLNATLQQDLAARSLVFNRPDPAPFRDKLRAAGFYTEWKAKYGDEAWSLLERSVGKLA